MLMLPPAMKVWACTQPVDCRKSFNGLSATVRSVLRLNPLDGHLFCFFNRRADQVRLLFWDRNGYLVLAKRLEKGTFKTPWTGAPPTGPAWELEAAELTLILEGIDLTGARRRPRWKPG
jgi:transposase